MDFRAYEPEWLDPFGVILFIIVALFILGAVVTMYQAYQYDLRAEQYKHVCVDAGGIPVFTHSYVKGEKDGHLCITPSAIIELKD